MSTNTPEQLPAACRWTSRLAVFSAVVLLVAAVLHRLGLPTPIAFNMVLMAYAGIVVAFVLAVMATVLIWRSGGGGTSRVVVGMVISLAMFAGAAVVVALAGRYPAINDVTTDVQSPPQFTEVVKLRGPGSNPAGYPKSFSAQQAKYYADLQPLQIDRPQEEAFDVALEVLKRQRYTIIQEDPAGTIEAVDRSMILGFSDDIAIRVTGTDERSRIDIRSASRFGISDFGHNAGRVRLLLKEIVARLEETVPSADSARASDSARAGGNAKPAKPGAKLEKERASKKANQRKQQDGDRSGAPREPGQKGTPLAKDGSRAPGKRPALSAE